MSALKQCLAGLAAACMLLAAPGAALANQWELAFPSSLDLARANLAPTPVSVRVGEPLPADLRFSLAVPGPDWRLLPGAGDYEGVRHLAGFISPQGPEGGQVEVLTHQLASEINFADWLLAVLTKSGVTVVGTRQDTGGAGDVFEALGVYASPRGDRMVRAAVYRSHKRLFVVRASAAPSSFVRLATAFAASTLFFRPEHLQKVFLTGDWTEHNLKSRLVFLGPKQGWSAAGGAGEELVFDLAQAAKVTGRLRVRLFEGGGPGGPTPARQMSRLAQSLHQTGMDLKWQDGSLALPKTSLPGVSCYYRAKGWSAAGDLEVFALYNGGPRGVLVWMVTAGQMANLPAWMANKRTFELVCRYMRFTGNP